MLRREYRKRGFTMIELVVVMLIMGILAGIAVPSLLGYIHLSQFRRDESYAKTMYLSAESTLTHYRASGQWEAFSFKVKEEGTLNTSFEATDERAGHIYALRLDAGEFGGDLSGDGALAA